MRFRKGMQRETARIEEWYGNLVYRKHPKIYEHDPNEVSK